MLVCRARRKVYINDIIRREGSCAVPARLAANHRMSKQFNVLGDLAYLHRMDTRIRTLKQAVTDTIMTGSPTMCAV